MVKSLSNIKLLAFTQGSQKCISFLNVTYGSKVIGLWRSKLNSKFIQRAKSKVAPIFLKIVSNCLSNVRESEKDKFTLSLMSLSWVMDQNVKVTIFFIEITVNSRFCLICRHLGIWQGANYSFSICWWVAEQFDTIFKKIGATWFSDHCTKAAFTFDLQMHITLEP